MEQKPRPTRAEVSDITNSVYDLTDANMTSGETTNGKFPIECAKHLRLVILVFYARSPKSLKLHVITKLFLITGRYSLRIVRVLELFLSLLSWIVTLFSWKLIRLNWFIDCLLWGQKPIWLFFLMRLMWRKQLLLTLVCIAIQCLNPKIPKSSFRCMGNTMALDQRTKQEFFPSKLKKVILLVPVSTK